MSRADARRRNLCAVVVCLLALLASLAGAEVAEKRVVAAGDVHGDFNAFVGILQQADLIDAEQHWTGGTAILVQTGDLLDRGTQGRQVMDLLMALEEQAPKDGGRVIVLLGNHEVMNLTGDLRYVPPEEYANYAEANSAERRAAAYKDYQELGRSRAQALGQQEPVFSPESEKAWMDQHPLGFLEQREAFAPEGKYGRWLRADAAVARVGTTIFLHGGISPALGNVTVEALNTRIQEEVKAFDSYKQYLVEQKIILPFFTLEEMGVAAQAELKARQAAMKAKPAEAGKPGEKPAEPTAEQKRHVQVLEALLRYGSWLSASAEGPLWFRGYAQWSEEEGAPQVTKLLAALGASQFVAGHTVQNGGRIRTRFGGKVLLIDTGMLSSRYPGGRASALEIQEGKFTAIYPDARVVLLEPAADGATRYPLNQ
ncbi:MAG: metallophosphoesterase [Candidatus Acidiferrales bacterium]